MYNLTCTQSKINILFENSINIMYSILHYQLPPTILCC